MKANTETRCFSRWTLAGFSRASRGCLAGFTRVSRGLFRSLAGVTRVPCGFHTGFMRVLCGYEAAICPRVERGLHRFLLHSSVLVLLVQFSLTTMVSFLNTKMLYRLNTMKYQSFPYKFERVEFVECPFIVIVYLPELFVDLLELLR